MLVVGIVAIAASVVALTFYLFQPEFAGLQSEQFKAAEQGDVSGARARSSTPVFDLIDRTMKSFGWRPFSEDELAMAAIKRTPTSMVAVTILVVLGAFMAGVILLGSVFLGLVLAVLAPLGVKFIVRMKTSRRRKAFASQIAETMQLFSSALKSGMNVPTALATVAGDMSAPMGEELSRIVNETRLGRDLVVAMTESAERMENEDFMWVTEAVAIQRESGGRLSEILDRVTETISERNEIKNKIDSLASEGKMSGYVLMALPIFVGGFFAIANTEYISPLWTTGAGNIIVVAAIILYIIGGFWMNSMTKVKI